MLELENRSISYLPGVGPKRAEVLASEANIRSFWDLLTYYPYKYIDRSRFYKICEINDALPYIQLKGKITSFELVGEGRARRLIAHFSDGTGSINLVWFKALHLIVHYYKVDIPYIIFGKPTRFGSIYEILHPDIDHESNEEQVSGGLVPFYNTSEKMKKSQLSSRSLQDLVFILLKNIGGVIPESLPEYLLQQLHLMPLDEALRNIHFPESTEKLKQASLRLKFDELFFIQLHLLQNSVNRKRRLKGIVFSTVGDYFNTFYREHLPFQLTNAQKRVVKEIRADLGSGHQMNRLLQGDVGSGKTLVALLSMLLALDNHCQACMMAPTEILAGQHYHTILRFLNGMDIRVALLTGSTKKREREKLLPAIASGEIQILIGTHALIEETVSFASLGLAIIDEQHRFGVEQRAKLWTKSPVIPHVLVMTATPIPRTLAMTLYGDLDISVIDELPPGRKPIKTIHRFDNHKAELFSFLRQQIQAGRQVYVVYPLIEGSEKSDYKNLEEGFENFKKIFPEFTVCMVHGRMKSVEKETEMQKFVKGEAQILMATTVIEVGVDVPNASVMVIESAERFGLSQLHQLRGRVGRGAEQSYCILVSDYNLNDDTRKRLDIMTSSNNGFVIAEEDLKMRGHGELEGTRQSGEGLDLKIADLASDGQILQYARDLANNIIIRDPLLESDQNRLLKEKLKAQYGNRINWELVS